MLLSNIISNATKPRLTLAEHPVDFDARSQKRINLVAGCNASVGREVVVGSCRGKPQRSHSRRVRCLCTDAGRHGSCGDQ